MDIYTLLTKLNDNRTDESGFNQVLREYAFSRLDGNKALEEPPEHQDLIDKVARASMDLAKTLTYEQMGMLLDYEIKQTEYWCKVVEDDYLLGLKNGLIMAEILRHFGIKPLEVN